MQRRPASEAPATFGPILRRGRPGSLLGLAIGLAACSNASQQQPSPEKDPQTREVVQRTSSLVARPTTPPPARVSTAVAGAMPAMGWVGHDGAYHYRIPIDVPPGRGGVAPSLAISYSSQAGNGPLGVGFTLEGPSSITRCEKIVADGNHRNGVLFRTVEDAYCLDGQRLALVSGVNGQAGAQYRTELESFSRVTLVTKSDPETITKWTVETKDGRTLIYEPLADNIATSGTEPWVQRQLVKADGTANGTATPTQLVWPLTRQYDRSGNGMRYSYVRSSGPTNDGGADVPLLQQIDYTTCEVTPCDFADAVRPRRVFLNWEARPAADKLERWVNGVVVRTKVRLKNILTLVRNDAQTWVPQRTYTLIYWSDDLDPANHRVTKRSLVYSVQMCEGTPVGGPTVACLPPTTFDWQSRAEHKLRFQGIENNFDYRGFVGDATQMEFVVYDANGDGNDDLVVHEPNQAAASGTGLFAANTTYKERVLLADGGGQFKSAVDVNWNAGACKSLTHLGMSQPVDLDGNGTTELVIECRNYGVLTWDPAAGTLVEVNVANITNRVQPNASIPPATYRGIEGLLKFADLTGDGLPELLPSGPAPDGTAAFSRWWRQNAQSTAGTGLAPRVSYAAQQTTAVRTAGPVLSDGTVMTPQVTTVLDLDGNGHQELVQLDYNRAMRSYEYGASGAEHSYRFQDVGNNVKWSRQVELPTEPLTDPKNWGTATYTTGTSGQGLWYFADVNGDGLKDAFYFTAPIATSTWSLRINTGEGFLAPISLDRNCMPNWVGPKGADGNLLVADMNGDGRDDIVALSGTKHLATPNWSGFAGTRDPIKVCYSNGAGFDAPVSLPLPDQGYRFFDDKDVVYGNNVTITYPAERFVMTQVGDFNGDGIADIIDFNGGITAGFTQGYREPTTTLLDPDAIRGGVDLITKVSDGRTGQTVIYDALSAGSRARLGTAFTPSGLRDTHLPTAATYPTASLQKGSAVRRFIDDGHLTPGRGTTTLHLYEGARTDLTGRGFVGFNRHYTIDQTTGDVTKYDFTTTPFSGGVAFHYQYAAGMRPIATQMRAQLTATTELSAPSSSLPAATGVVDAPGMTLAEVYQGYPLRLDHVYYTDTMGKRTSGGPVTDTGTFVFRELAYDTWGNVTTETVHNNQTADPTFTAHYTRSVISEYNNTVNATTWRLGELRRQVETNQSTDPYVTSSGSVASDTRTTEFYYDAKGRLEWIVREPTLSTIQPQGSNGELTMTRFTRNNAGQVTVTRRYSPTATTCSTNANCSAGQECTNATTGAVKLCWNTRADSVGYDVSGTFPESFTNALGQTRWVLYDSSNLLPYLSADENGVKTVLTRDGFGRVRQSSHDSGASTNVTYARDVSSTAMALGGPFDIIRTTEAGGSRGSVFLDRYGHVRYRTWSTFSGGTGVSEASYDLLGNVTRTRYTSSSSSEGTVAATVDSIDDVVTAGMTVTAQASYDRAGRLLSSTQGTNESSSYLYPAYGEIAVSDGEGFIVSTVMGSQGRVMARKQGAHTVRYRYKGEGPLASITGSSNHIDRFFYDRIGRRTQWTTGTIGGGSLERLGAVTYDSFDRMTASSRDGVPVTRGYDALDRMTSRNSGGEAQTFVWDTGAIGRLKRAYNNDLSHDLVNTYDSLGRLSEERHKFASGGTSLSFGYEYDSVGRISRLRYPEYPGANDVSAVSHTSRGGFKVQYNYQNNQLLSLTEVATGDPVLWRADTRHVMGMTTAATYGASADPNRLTASWAYGPNTLRLASHNVTGVSSGPAPTQAFTYQNNGKLKTRVSSGLNERYSYDGSLGFLKTYHRDNGAGQKLIDATFSFDDDGMTGIDTTASTASPDWPIDDEAFTNDTPDYTYRLNFHQVGSAPRRRYGYDVQGRVDLVTDGGAACTSNSQCPAGDFCQIGSCWHNRRSITSNSFNLPTQIQDFATNVTRTFGYDAYGNRVRKTQDASNQVLYLGKLYEQRNLTALGARESVYRLYTDVGVVAELVHPWGGTGRTTRYLFSDHQGSIAFSVVNRVSTQLGFFPYGKRMGIAPSQNFSQLGYTGHYQDDDLNLVNMGGRVYDVSSRRFLSRDPVIDSPLQVFGANAYAYVVHDPVNRIDPTGFASGRYQGTGLTIEGCRDDGKCTVIIPSEPPPPPPPPSPPDNRITNHELPAQPTPQPAPVPLAQPPAPAPLTLPPSTPSEQLASAASDAGSRLTRSQGVPSIPSDSIVGKALDLVMQGVAAEHPYVVGSDSMKQPSPFADALFDALSPALANAADAAIEPWTRWPINDGFYGRQRVTIEKGTVLSRYGDDDGEFLAPVEVPFSQRGLPPEYATEKAYHMYLVAKPFEAYEGIALPLRDGSSLGGGQQFQAINHLVRHLVRMGNLIELAGPSPPPR